MQTLIIETEKTESGKLKALMLFLTALEIPFKKAESPYKADFVAKIRESEQDKKAGRTRKITLDDVWK